MTPFSDSLAAGIAQMRLNISPAQQQKLLAYLALLQKWNKTYNLTALRDPAQMVNHHLLDSLTLLPYLAQAESMIDVGSGGGMPAIPAAIELGLDNIAVSSSRVEELGGQRADIVTSRAFAELADFVRLTRHLLNDNGHWAAMKGVYPADEIFRLPPDIQAYQTDKIHVPTLNAERHIVLLRPTQGTQP